MEHLNTLFLAKFREVLLHQLQATTNALSKSLGSRVAISHAEQGDSLGFCPFSPFAKPLPAPCDSNKSSNEQLLEGVPEIEFSDFDMVDTPIVMHDEPASIVRPSQLDYGQAKVHSMSCLTAPRDSPLEPHKTEKFSKPVERQFRK